MTILNDTAIAALARRGMIQPFESGMIRAVEFDPDPFGINLPPPRPPMRPVLSYGCGSYGYDIRLSPKDFRVFRHIPGTVVDPKRFNPANLESVPLHEDGDERFFILPAHTYGLGVALEYLDMPCDVTAVCVGKSTMARAGIIANTTPAEAGWCGHLTLEFSNSSSADCRIYANEGIVQLLFFQGEPCEISYRDRSGKYQDQDEVVTLAKV